MLLCASQQSDPMEILSESLRFHFPSVTLIEPCQHFPRASRMNFKQPKTNVQHYATHFLHCLLLLVGSNFLFARLMIEQRNFLPKSWFVLLLLLLLVSFLSCPSQRQYKYATEKDCCRKRKQTNVSNAKTKSTLCCIYALMYLDILFI
jgi:glucan phosphoethanolaminetransferase (alkaline phosphatase superfamily)